MTSQGTGAQAREETERVAGTAGDEARRVADQAKGEARSLTEEARDRSKDIARDTGRRLRGEADGQVSRAASAMRDVGSDLRAMSEAETDSGSDGVAPQIARTAAEWMEDTAGRLERDGFDGIISDAERFARRNPGMFMAAAAGVGLVVGRLARNSSKDAFRSGDSGADDGRSRPTADMSSGPGVAGSGAGSVPPTNPATSPTYAGGGGPGTTDLPGRQTP